MALPSGSPGNSLNYLLALELVNVLSETYTV